MQEEQMNKCAFEQMRQTFKLADKPKWTHDQIKQNFKLAKRANDHKPIKQNLNFAEKNKWVVDEQINQKL